MSTRNITEDRQLPSGLIIYRDWDCDGAIYMRNAKTVGRYLEISQEHPDLYELGCFAAFNDKQFKEGRTACIERGSMTEDSEIFHYHAGIFGTKEGIIKMCEFYQGKINRIVAECEPQEVYFYEYNNHECMIAYDGDLDVIRIIADYWGEEVARQIVRFSVFYDLESALKD